MNKYQTATRGFVLMREGYRPSAIVQKTRAAEMRKRFGGKLVSAAGLRYTMVNGFRCVAQVDNDALMERYNAI